HSQSRKSLEDVMRLLWARYGRYIFTGTSQEVAEAAMPEFIQEATGINTRDFINRSAYGCDDLPLTELFADQGIKFHWKSSTSLPSLDVRFSEVTCNELKLATVYENGAAHQAGLSAGDLLIAIDGLRVTSQQRLNQLLKAYQAGDRVQLHVFRRDELRSFTAQLSPAPLDMCSLSLNASTSHE